MGPKIEVEKRLQKALADLRLQEHPNIQNTAQKYSVDRSTLLRWFRNVT